MKVYNMKHYIKLALISLFALTGCKHKNEIKPERKDIVDAVFGSGHLENAGQYTVMASTEGFLSKAYVAEGDTVKNDQVLFRLSNEVQATQVANARVNLDYAQANAAQGSPQIAQLKIQIAQARQKLTIDSANYARYSRLVTTKAVSASDYENARLNYQNSASSLGVLQKNLADLERNLRLNLANSSAQYRIQKENNAYYTLTSSGPGVVMNISKKEGDYVRKGDAIAMVGTGRLSIKLDIAEEDIPRIQTGQRALISMNSEKDRNYEAVITKIYPAFNTTEQSFIVEAAFKEQPAHPLNGTQLQANIIVGQKKNALVIPSYALVSDSYVLVGKQKKKVTTGIRTLEWTEITGGITEHEILTLPKAQ